MIEQVQTLADILRSRYFGSGRVTGCDLVIQEAQLPQRDRATHIYRTYRLRDIMAPHGGKRNYNYVRLSVHLSACLTICHTLVCC